MTEMKLVKTVFLKAPAKHVWTFLTDPEKLATWFHKGRGGLAPGGDWILETNSYGKEGEAILTGKVIEMNEPHRLVHTFTHQWLKGVETLCTWTLEDVPGGTILTLTHEGWEKLDETDAFTMGADHDKGWDEHFVRLRAVTG